MVGNYADAHVAASRPGECFVGSGSFRESYLINGVIYKIVYEGDGYLVNLDEWDNYENMCEAVEDNIAIPETSLWPVGPMPVIAMQYVKGTLMGECYCTPDEECQDWCLPEEILDRLYDYGYTDPSYGNVIYDGRTYWVVDFQ